MGVLTTAKNVIALYKPSRSLTDLPKIDMRHEVQGGRVIHDGYQRGWGIQFGALRAAVNRDPLFRAARSIAREHKQTRSNVSADRLMNLFLIIRFFLKDLPKQDIVEFGSYRGGSALFMAYLLSRLYPGARVTALDTFEGMPAVDSKYDLHKAGDFRETNLAVIRARAAELELTNVSFVPGLIEDTAPSVYEHSGPFGLAHIDVDIYSAVKFAQDTVFDHIIFGGYVVYDDATDSSCIGATKAVEELIADKRLHSEQVWPHFVFRAGM